MNVLYAVRHAVRALARQPGFTAAAIATLALGLGLNAAVFAVAYGILWRPLPFPDSDGLVRITARFEDGDGGGIGTNRFPEWAERLRTVDLAGYELRERSLRGAGPLRVIAAANVTRDFFAVLGLPAAEGIAPPLAAGDPRVVISPRLASAFDTVSGAPAVGRAITIGDDRYDVAGVMPAAFAFPTAAVDAWIALPAGRAEMGSGLDLVGRLRPGSSLAQAREDATRVARDVRSAEWSASVVALEGLLRDDTRPAVLASLAGALLVLVVACANTITLMLGRSIARGREFAVRSALGAGAGRICRAAIVEGLVIAGGGLATGLFAAWAGLQVFTTRAAAVLPRVDAIGLDAPALLVSAGLTLAVALACGGAAAAGALRRDGAELLGGTVRTATPGARRVRAALVAAQLALSIVLLTGAGLLARSVGALLAEDAGYDPGPVLVATLQLDDTRFIDDGTSTVFVDRLLQRARALPGVDAAGLGSLLPPADAPTQISLYYKSETRDDMTLSFGAVTSGFFEALGTPLRGGRRFAVQDERAETADAIVSESAARFILPGEDPVGRTTPYSLPALGITADTRMLGVVADMKYAGLDSPPDAAVYVPWQLRPMGRAHLVVRTSRDPAALAAPVRDLIRELDPNLPIPDVRTLDDHIVDSIAGRRLQLAPVAAVAGLALAVAMVGLFGTLGRAVAERRHELSIRAALGAAPRSLVGLVLRGSLAIAAVGLVAGLAAAAATGRGLSSLLYGVSPYDPLTFAGVAGVVLAATLVATIVPARRAARIDPLVALKED